MNIEKLLLIDGKMYKYITSDNGLVICTLIPIEIVTHLTDEGLRYTIREENDNV